MKAHKRKTAPAADPPAPHKNGRKAPREPALNRLLAPDARWQRFQRYVWDRKKG
jgi:hypothetical protein